MAGTRPSSPSSAGSLAPSPRLAVNNNAAALHLILSVLALGRDVIVSRGEAVEIGGGVRVPEILSASGARLVEVGTTNRTYLSDYRNAITENTALFLKVHSSNFKVIGFTEAPDTGALAALGRESGIPVVHDVGSGCLVDTRDFGLSDEPRPQDSIAAGMDLVAFSGDKLLGGPQAGIIAGRQVLVSELARHPLARAARIDKMTMAALTATLLHYLKEEHLDKVPVWRMISMPLETIKLRALAWRDAIGNGRRRCRDYVDHRWRQPPRRHSSNLGFAGAPPERCHGRLPRQIPPHWPHSCHRPHRRRQPCFWTHARFSLSRKLP